ncbi:hypothetical protein FRX31_024365 [Thalictrum thalictroides]|uniref:Prolamin-like domain-containing protein n=1 Tax=Thalictrum thalictroides TaxID=46969 RepID=A0A7J6VN41_THATH|nr:hypothetical protein FRX31_024365 [Thalictrum thalictroides]
MASIRMMIVCLVVAGTFMVVPSLSLEAPSTSPAGSFDAKPPSFYDFVEKCANKFGTKCPKIGDLIIGKTNVVSVDCCNALINIGKHCHDALLTVLLQVKELKQFSSVIPQRGAWLWNYCANISPVLP